MINLEEEHAKVVLGLKNIKRSMDEMRDEGLGGDDFEGLYLMTKLVPAISKIFESDTSPMTIVALQHKGIQS